MTAALDRYDTLSFDCYGTLIDWETGLRDALARTLPGAGLRDEPELLETFGTFEADEEAASPHLPYPMILARVHARLATAWNLPGGDAVAFGASIGGWPAFPDAAEALRTLKGRHRLVVLSNVDRHSFAASSRRLGDPFDAVYTAEEIGSYKPDPRNFEFMLARLAALGVQRERVLHCAQSLFHDHVPAKRLGLATCWIDRRQGRDGWGATPPPGSAVEPDYRFRSLDELALA